MSHKIAFGTDGWRGIIADDFTFDNVRLVTRAVAAYVNSQGIGQRGLVWDGITVFWQRSLHRQWQKN
ncbi:hypothetical protein N752_00355 [Desulforamulus aquiferis]|nr:hypothetical protein N752_00355 [Desulforamulus aquiferis]